MAIGGLPKPLLDDALPVVTFGAYSGDRAGEVFKISYRVDERVLRDLGVSILVEAKIVRGSFSRQMTVIANSPADTGRLEVLLPDGIFSGIYRIEALARDSIGQEALSFFNVEILAPLVEPPAGPPAYPRRREDRFHQVSGTSRVRTRGATHLAASVPFRSTVVTHSGRVQTTHTVGRTRATIGALDRLVMLVVNRDGLGIASTGRVASRRDGRELEEVLLLLVD